MTRRRDSAAPAGRGPVPPPAVESAVLANVRRIASLEEDQLRARTSSERIARVVMRAAGTATFALAHFVWFVVWISINAGLVHGIKPFDRFPFNLLTMIVSLEAIFLSIWILISQNLMTRHADRRAHLDLQINLLAEQESTATLRVVNRIAKHLGVAPDTSVDTALAEETDLEHLVSRMDAALPDTPRTSASELPPRPEDVSQS